MTHTRGPGPPPPPLYTKMVGGGTYKAEVLALLLWWCMRAAIMVTEGAGGHSAGPSSGTRCKYKRGKRKTSALARRTIIN